MLPSKLRKLFQQIPAEKKKRAIKWYVKNHHIYDQGMGIMGTLRVISFEKIVAGMACLKIIWPGISPWWIFAAGLIYYPIRTVFNWSIGYFWEAENGYKTQAAWAAERAIPQRIYIEEKKDVIKGREFSKDWEIEDGDSRGHSPGTA